MKTIAAVLLASVAGVGAADVRLTWNPSPSPGITNYAVYCKLASPATNFVVNVGTNLTCTLADLKPGIWTFYATAGKDGIESPPSNLLTVEMAQPPEGMRTLVVQYSATLTNWQDVGFFKLRVP